MSRQLDWYHRNKERALKTGKIYYDTNKEEIKLYERNKYKNDGKRKRETSRLRYHANKKVRDEQIKKYKQEHPEVGHRASLKIIKRMSDANKMDTTSYIYASINWKRLIKKNDEDRCVVCGTSDQDIELHAHHLIFKSTEPALALSKSNGVMLCVPDHKELHKLNPIKQKH